MGWGTRNEIQSRGYDNFHDKLIARHFFFFRRNLIFHNKLFCCELKIQLHTIIIHKYCSLLKLFTYAWIITLFFKFKTILFICFLSSLKSSGSSINSIVPSFINICNLSNRCLSGGLGGVLLIYLRGSKPFFQPSN